MKIVLVDDSGVQRKITTNIIRKAGFENEVLEASSGSDALDILIQEEHDIGLVICDWNMPGMTGYELIQRMAKNAEISHIPIIMATTQATEENIQQAHEANPKVSGYVKKPFTAEQLAEEVKKVL